MKRAFYLLLLLSVRAAAENGIDLGDSRRTLLADPVRIGFQPSGAPPTMDAIRQALRIGGGDWRVASENDKGVELTREVRGKHLVRVAVDCDPKACLIHYRQSINMLYAEKTISGAELRTIHKNYNVWVHELARALANRIGVQARVSDGFAAIDDVAAVPFLGDGGRKGYAEFLQHQKPRAFAVADNGAWAWAAPRGTPTYGQLRNFDPIGRAMERCERRGAACKLYAVDDVVVWR